MKGKLRILASAMLLALALACVCACTAEEEADYEFPAEGFFMKARITAINDRIEVEVIESEYTSGIIWVNTNEETPVLDENGKKIEISDLAVGDVIEIAYSGQIMMSYPGQIVGQAIRKVK